MVVARGCGDVDDKGGVAGGEEGRGKEEESEDHANKR